MLCLLAVCVPFILTLSPGHQHEGPISTHHLRASACIGFWENSRRLVDCDPVTFPGLGLFSFPLLFEGCGEIWDAQLKEYFLLALTFTCMPSGVAGFQPWLPFTST